MHFSFATALLEYIDFQSQIECTWSAVRLLHVILLTKYCGNIMNDIVLQKLHNMIISARCRSINNLQLVTNRL